MNNKTVLSGFVSCLVLTAALVAACSGGSRGNARPMGMAAIVIRDGTVQSSDGRTVTSVFVEISRITLRAAEVADDEDGEHQDMNENENGDDGDDGGEDQGTDVVVFDMFRDNGGVPREVDLLTLTDSGVLFNMLQIPVGTYDKARVTLVGASAIFADDSTQTPVPLAIEGGEDSQIKVDFQPPVEVTEAGTTIAAIDIVPVITFDGTAYTLSNDGASDQSGECGDGELEIEVEGRISAVNGSQIQVGDFGLTVDLSQMDPVLVVPGMEVEISGFMANGVLVAQSIDFGD